MAASFSLMDTCNWCSSKHFRRKPKQLSNHKLRKGSSSAHEGSHQCRVWRGSNVHSIACEFRRGCFLGTNQCHQDAKEQPLPLREVSLDTSHNRRIAVFCSGASLLSIFAPSPIKAEENTRKEQEDERDSDGVVGAIKSIFDPNERTKSGKVLPKAYLKAAREVVKTLRESLGEDAKDVAKFRRTADAAKESIREYLSGWRGRQDVVAEESYVALEKAIRSLASFYSKAGPFGTLSEEVKSSILDDLNTADANL